MKKRLAYLLTVCTVLFSYVRQNKFSLSIDKKWMSENVCLYTKLMFQLLPQSFLSLFSCSFICQKNVIFCLCKLLTTSRWQRRQHQILYTAFVVLLCKVFCCKIKKKLMVKSRTQRLVRKFSCGLKFYYC